MNESEEVSLLEINSPGNNENISEDADILDIRRSQRFSKIIYLLPILFVICVIPLITYGKIVELTPMEADFWKGGTTHVDFFSYYKAVFLRISAFIMVIFLAKLYFSRNFKFYNDKRYYILMIIYVACVILSTVFAYNKTVALLGFIEMYQGMSVLLSYILIMFYVMNIVNDEKDVKIIVNAFVVLVIIVGILGISQYFGYDLLQTDIGKSLITPKELEGAELKFSSGKFSISGTMYNSNFVGSYGALVLPMMIMLYLYSDGRKQIIYLIASILAYTTWLGCNSRAGYLGIIFSVLIAIIFFRKIIKDNYKKLLLLSIIYIVITIIFNVASNGRVSSQLTRLSPITEAKSIDNVQKNKKVWFEEISVKDNTFTVRTTTEELIAVVKNYELSIKDGDGQVLETVTDREGNITLKDNNYKEYAFANKKDSPFVKVKLYGRTLDLIILEDDTLRAVSYNYKLTEPVTAPRFKLFDGRETFASHRGYIWSRTIPMIKDTLVLGYGPDNYGMVFPQEDYVGRFNTGNGMTKIIIDKPHNMYMQTAVNTGAISLLSLVFIWGIYVIDCNRLYKNRGINTVYDYIGIASFMGVTAYLAAGMFNDNIISVTPLFWTLLGLGTSINKMNKQNKSLHE
ncbi:MAG: O-antigen ligase family protein [Sedimentibacter sp.]